MPSRRGMRMSTSATSTGGRAGVAQDSSCLDAVRRLAGNQVGQFGGDIREQVPQPRARRLFIVDDQQAQRYALTASRLAVRHRDAHQVKRPAPCLAPG